MLRWGQTPLVVLAVSLVFWGGCKKEKPEKAPVKATAPKVPTPKAVMVFVGVKNPGRTIDDALALIREFVPLPFNRAGLLDLFAQRARLPREMVAAIDIEKPLWVVGMDERELGTDPDPLLMVLPLRSRKSFEEALAAKLEKAGTDGKLTLYKPKPGAVGTQTARLFVTQTHVWAASSRKAFDEAEAFVRGTLIPSPPAHDIAVHVAVENILRERGDDLDRRVDRAMDRIRESAKSGKGPAQEQVAGATERTVRRWLDALRSTREAQLIADVNREQLTLSARVLATGKGRLADLVRRQQPGPPYGYTLLPASSWLVLSDRSNPEAQAEGRKTWAPLLREMLRGLASTKQEALVTAVTAATELFSGDYSVALHRAPTGDGLAASMVTRITDQKKALAALDRVAGALSQWIKAVLARSREKVPQGVRVERTPFVAGMVKGALFKLHLQLPPNKQAQVERVIGIPITLGVAFSRDHGLLSLGKGAEEQLKTLAAGTDPGKVADSLADSPAFNRARQAGTDRVGLLYFSLVDFVRWFEGTGMKELETIAAALKEQKVQAAPSLDWGVDKPRTALDVTLRLPAAHFRAFKPIVEELQKKGLFGGRQPAWDEF